MNKGCISFRRIVQRSQSLLEGGKFALFSKYQLTLAWETRNGNLKELESLPSRCNLQIEILQYFSEIWEFFILFPFHLGR